MEPHSIGKGLLVAGIFLAVIGGVVMLSPKIPWLGRLPGDIYIKREHFSFYFPLATCLIISLVLTLAVRLFKK